MNEKVVGTDIRLKEIRNDLSYSQSKFASILDLPQSTYSKYELGYAVSDKLLLGLYNLGINLNWFITGQGEKYSSNSNLTSSKDIEFKTPSGKSYPVSSDVAIYSVPILASKVSAGKGEEWLPSDYSGESLPTLEKFFFGYPKDDIFAAKVIGDSMIGIDLLPGDYVYACHGRIEGNGLYVLTLDGETYVKRLEIDKIDRKIRIISENDHYPDKVVDPERVIILGKVIGWLHRTPY